MKTVIQIRRLGLLILISLSTGCSIISANTQPLETIHYGTGAGDTLIILLPGIGDQAADFERHGFISAVEALDPAIDIIAVDAGLAHYLTDKLVTRLKNEIILPARRRGYARIWLAGISLGAMGAMLYVHENALDVDGIIAISPYLGNQRTIKAMQAADSPSEWRPPAAVPGDFRPPVWHWLREHARDNGGTRLFLAYGSDDRFAEGHELVASILPREQVTRIPGGHDWETWRRLWRIALRDLQDTLGATQIAAASE